MQALRKIQVFGPKNWGLYQQLHSQGILDLFYEMMGKQHIQF